MKLYTVEVADGECSDIRVIFLSDQHALEYAGKLVREEWDFHTVTVSEWESGVEPGYPQQKLLEENGHLNYEDYCKIRDEKWKRF